MTQLPVTVYRQISPPATGDQRAILAKFRISLPDQPGSLARFASMLNRDGELKKRDGCAMIFPGHGAYYPAGELHEK